MHGVQQVETAAASARAHVQFAVVSTTETTKILGRTFSDMSCARTPSWNRRRSQGDRPRRCRHNDRMRFGAAFLTVVFVLPLSDVTVVDGERAVLECSSHTCRRGHVVRPKCQRSSWRDDGTVRRHDAVDVARETSRVGHRGPETRGSPRRR